MTDAKLEPQIVRRFDLGRVFSTLFRPRQTFSETASEARSSWLTPMLIISITALLAVLVSGYLKSQAAMLGEVPLPPDWQYMTPEMQNNYMQAQQLSQGKATTYILPLFSSWFALWVGWLGLAGLLHLGSTLLGGRGSMQSATNVTAWAILPFALRDLLRVLYMLASSHTITSPSLSGFATSTFMVQVLAHTDIFLLWSLVLLIIGFSINDGLSRAKATVGVILVAAILLAVRAGLGALVANIGSTLQGGMF
jgi:hypothetical protein